MTAEQFADILVHGIGWGLGLGVFVRFFGWCILKVFRIMKIAFSN